MEFKLQPGSACGSLVSRQLPQEILATNREAAQYGLRLTEPEAAMLAQTNQDAIAAQDRIEFGRSAALPLIEAFMRSSYLAPDNYAETLSELLDIFYEAKETCNDLVSDEQLIRVMFADFETTSGGDTERLRSYDLPRFYDYMRKMVSRGIPAKPARGEGAADDV